MLDAELSLISSLVREALAAESMDAKRLCAAVREGEVSVTGRD